MNNALLQKRYYFVVGGIVLVALIYMVRLFYLQVIDRSYRNMAEQTSVRRLVEQPARGFIYDRNDSLLVYNDAAYDLMVVPRDMREFDTNDLCRTLEIPKEELLKRIAKATAYSKVIPSIIDQQISKEDYGYLQEKLYRFPGFFVQNRTLRHYAYPVAAHILGYVGEVDERTLERDSYYRMGDYIGKSGIERSYEEELRGEKGIRVVLVDVSNRERGSYKNGEEDELPIQGQSLWSTIDLPLQQYGEKLMTNKRGSIVAIEPATGEILCIVSSPAYDPNLLVGKDLRKNFAQLLCDTVKVPLFNRALQAAYPPGSTFKLANGLIALQEKVVTPSTVWYCSGGYHMGSHTVGCHHAGPTNLVSAVQHSCNFYFCNALYHIIGNKKYKNVQEGYQVWREYLLSMGFGVTFNSDLPFDVKGIIPTSDYFDRIYRKSWNPNSVISMGIGQGEASVTPLQMANFLAIVANRGYYYKPHVVKAIGSKDNPNKRYSEKIYCKVDSKYFDPILEGMDMAVQAGTARGAKIDGVHIIGKTGTAQNPHGRDHSVFASIAPKNDPKIVVFVLVENGGFGATVACPIASLITEFYLNREVKRKDLEERIISMSIK